MYNWQNRIKSEHGEVVDFLRSSAAVYDNDHYCRGFLHGVEHSGIPYCQMIVNQKRDEALGIVCEEEYVRLFRLEEKPLLEFEPSVGTIVDTRAEPVVKVGHKDVINYLIDNVSQIREPIYHIDNINDLRDSTPSPPPPISNEEMIAIVLVAGGNPSLN